MIGRGDVIGRERGLALRRALRSFWFRGHGEAGHVDRAQLGLW
jgi:hypothetical protein